MSRDWPDLAGRLVGARHVLPVRIYFEDTDFSGVVYHGAWIRFLERGRSDFLRSLGIVHRDLHKAGSGAFAVRGMTVEFLRPASIDDIVEVETRVETIGGASVTLAQMASRAGERLIEASVRVAFVAGGRPRRLPPSVAIAFRGLEADMGGGR